MCIFFFQAEDGIRDKLVTGVQTCALPISLGLRPCGSTQKMSGTSSTGRRVNSTSIRRRPTAYACCSRSEEHTSELQSLAYLVCRLLLEKKKNENKLTMTTYTKRKHTQTDR